MQIMMASEVMKNNSGKNVFGKSSWLRFVGLPLYWKGLCLDTEKKTFKRLHSSNMITDHKNDEMSFKTTHSYQFIKFPSNLCGSISFSYTCSFSETLPIPRRKCYFRFSDHHNDRLSRAFSFPENRAAERKVHLTAVTADTLLLYRYWVFSGIIMNI
jgi:hypothetical protein